jgi:hypothetical protein
MKKFLINAIFIFMICATALALDISVKATVADNRVAMGSSLQYTITVRGVQDLQPPVLPAFDGFDVRYVGPATRVSVINNSYSVEQAFNYVLVPTKEGKFNVPSVPVTVNGLTLTTEEVPVEVVPAGSPSGASEAASDPQQDIQSRLKLLVTVPRDKAYVGEGVPLTLRLYVNQLSLQDLSFPEIAEQGFQMDPFSDPKQFQDTIQGVDWQVVEFSTVVYPSKAGEMLISPATLRGALLFKNTNQGDQSGGIFDQGFFSNFFSNYQKRQVTITSRAIKLDVLPLPEEGKPADFSGAVGQYDLTVDAAPLKVKSGDPITLRMALTGAGNLKAVKMPVFQESGFKLYDPQIKDDPQGGRKTLEQVIIPTDVKITAIAPVRFSYFDTTTGTYRTIERGPFALEVTAPASGEEFQAVGFAQPSLVSAPETLGRDIVFIKDSPGRFEKRSGRDRQDVVFFILLAVYIQLWAGFLAFYIYRQRLLNDPRFARQVSAARQACRMLQIAGDRLRAGHMKPFYDILESALRDYFVQRLELPPGRTDVATVVQRLKVLRVEEKYITIMEDISAAAEQVRFAGMVMPDDKMRTHLADAQDLVRGVERRVK